MKVKVIRFEVSITYQVLVMTRKSSHPVRTNQGPLLNRHNASNVGSDYPGNRWWLCSIAKIRSEKVRTGGKPCH